MEDLRINQSQVVEEHRGMQKKLNSLNSELRLSEEHVKALNNNIESQSELVELQATTAQ